MTSAESISTATPTPNREIAARAGTYYRTARYIITVVIIGMGLWFGYDGFRGYPKHNQRVDELEARLKAAPEAEKKQIELQITQHGKRKTETDIRWQKRLFFILPPIGIALLIRWLYISRGEYRLTGDNVLHVRGHPPVPFDSIVEVDKRLWDRKGIALISYELSDGTKGTLKLDDFVYEREPTDEIFKRIEDHVTPQAQPQSDQAPQEQSAGS